MKKIIFMFLALSAFSALAFCETKTGTYGDLNWKFIPEDSTIVFSGNGEFIEPDRYMWAGWNIAHVVLEEGITKIGSKFSQLFMEMKTLELPNSLTTISEDFIQSRTNLEYLKFPNNIDSLPGWTISNSPTLKYAKLPSKLKKIKSNAFIQDTSLAYLEIPAGVKEIATLAVNEKNIQKLVLLSDSYYTNVENAFASLFQSHNAPLLVLVDSSLVEKYKTALNSSSYSNISVEAVKTNLDYNESKKILTIETNRNLFENPIEESAFKTGKEKNATTIAFKNSPMGAIDADVFNSYPNLKTIYFDDESANITLQLLGKIKNPSALSLQFESFDGAQNFLKLASENWHQLNWQLHFAVNDSLYFDYDLKNQILTIGGKGAIPDYDIASTPWYLAADSVKKIVVKEGITEIGNYALNNLKYTSLTLPKSLRTIKTNAIGNSDLDSLIIPEGVETIEANAVFWCRNLKYIKLPKSLKTMEMSPFGFSSEKILKIDMPESMAMTAIPELFAGDASLMTSITLPNNITRIEAKAFSSSDLKSIQLPHSIKTISESAFETCKNLKSVVIPKNIKSIEASAFANNPNLDSIVIFAAEPPVTSQSAFNAISENAKVYVPYGTLKLYQAEIPYSSMKLVEMAKTAIVKNRVRITKVEIQDGRILNAACKNLSVYNLNGTKIYSGNDAQISVPTKGIYLVKTRN